MLGYAIASGLDDELVYASQKDALSTPIQAHKNAAKLTARIIIGNKAVRSAKSENEWQLVLISLPSSHHSKSIHQWHNSGSEVSVKKKKFTRNKLSASSLKINSSVGATSSRTITIDDRTMPLASSVISTPSNCATLSVPINFHEEKIVTNEKKAQVGKTRIHYSARKKHNTVKTEKTNDVGIGKQGKAQACGNWTVPKLMKSQFHVLL